MSRRDVISITTKSNFKKTTDWLNKHKKSPIQIDILHRYGQEGVDALKAATPKRTGLTANSWYYEIRKNNNEEIEIVWCNSNVVKEYANVAVLIQYGHATKNGGYVEGIDYINPALKPIFQRIADEAFREARK